MAAPPGAMKSANAYGRPSSAAQTPLCGDDPSQPRDRTLRWRRQGCDLRQAMRRRQAVPDVGEQLRELLGEVVRASLTLVALQGPGGERVAAGRTAEPEVDAIRAQRRQHAKGLGDFQGAVVRQHDAAAANANAGGGEADRPDERFRAHAGQHARAVMLGDPVAGIPEPIGGACQVDGVPQGLPGSHPVRDGRLVEHAEG